jgi:hypothetical protein
MVVSEAGKDVPCFGRDQMKVRTILGVAALAIGTITAFPAMAAEAQAAATPAPAFSTAATDIGTLLDNPQTRAVLDKHMPAFAANPQIEMARAMTLRQIQSFAADMLTDEVLAKVDADLAKIAKAG